MSASLQLPEGSEIAFRNLKDAKLLAMDIGGSLTKIAYYSTVPVRRIVYDAETPRRRRHRRQGSSRSVGRNGLRDIGRCQTSLHQVRDEPDREVSRLRSEDFDERWKQGGLRQQDHQRHRRRRVQVRGSDQRKIESGSFKSWRDGLHLRRG